MLTFKETGHIYESPESPDIKWTGVTTFVSQFKEKFDAEGSALKASKNKKSKWYNMSVDDILAVWQKETHRAQDLGNWYHRQREKDMLEFNTISRSGVDVPIYPPIEIDGIKYAPEQRLTEGVYPEHMVYLESMSLCGQSDVVEVVNGVVSITDYKTNKEIKAKGYRNWDGKVSKMLPPVSHLDDCNLNHYALQLSLYMYIILKHNPQLVPGVMMLNHITFEEDGKDAYGYPITKEDVFGEPIVKEIVQYQVPYLKSEVQNMLNYANTNI